jgi:hypothetical protein
MGGRQLTAFIPSLEPQISDFVWRGFGGRNRPSIGGLGDTPPSGTAEPHQPFSGSNRSMVWSYNSCVYTVALMATRDIDEN